MLFSEYFWLDRTSQGVWTIRHQITNQPAGTLHFNGHRFVLTTEHASGAAGEYDTLDEVMKVVYDNC